MLLIKAVLVLVPAAARRAVRPRPDDWERVFSEFRHVLETRFA